MTEGTEARPDTLFFDGECPICSREIKQLKRLSDENLAFVDINTEALSAEESESFSRQLHVQRANGDWVTGIEANVLVWQHTRYAGIARLLLLPGVKQVSALGYKTWLVYYQWQRKQRLKKRAAPAKRESS